MKPYRIVLAITLLFACSDDTDSGLRQPTWTKLGLDGKSVNEIQVSGDDLYVATTTGLFAGKMSSASGFSLIGFENKNVEALEIIGEEILIVSIFDKTFVEPPALFKSIDAGATWELIDSDFGGQMSEPVFDLEVDPENGNVIFATGYGVVAKSVNQGRSWQPVYGDWGGFATGVSVVEINPTGDKQIWAGGQGAIENGFLLRSYNEVDWDVWSDLVDNPTVVKEITFSDKDQDEVFVGFEGALLKTIDGGDSWETLIKSEENRFFFGIALQEGNPNRVYAGGWLKTPGPQSLILFTSLNGGQSWQEFRHHPETYGGILDMQISTQGGKDILVVGLDKGGVYKIEFDH